MMVIAGNRCKTRSWTNCSGGYVDTASDIMLMKLYTCTCIYKYIMYMYTCPYCHIDNYNII